MAWFLIVGAALQVAGFILAAGGFLRTWREHAPGQDFWEPIKQHARRFEDLVRRLIRRPRVITIQPEGGRIAVGPGTLEVKVTWQRLGSPVEDLEGFGARVQDQIDLLHEMAQNNQRSIADEMWARIATEVRTDTAMKREAKRVEALARRVAVGGLRWEVVGWLLLLVGLVLVSVGSVGLALQS